MKTATTTRTEREVFKLETENIVGAPKGASQLIAEGEQKLNTKRNITMGC